MRPMSLADMLSMSLADGADGMGSYGSIKSADALSFLLSIQSLCSILTWIRPSLQHLLQCVAVGTRLRPSLQHLLQCVAVGTIGVVSQKQHSQVKVMTVSISIESHITSSIIMVSSGLSNSLISAVPERI